MNRTIISIEVQDNGGKEATIIVNGERNNQILFEEKFDYKDEEKRPLRLHLLKEQFMNKDFAEGKSLGVMSIRKLFKDITKRSKSVGVPDYRTIDNYIDRNGNRQYFPKSPSEIRKNSIMTNRFSESQYLTLKEREHEKVMKTWLGVISVQQRKI